jgi:hypothetical protein
MDLLGIIFVGLFSVGAYTWYTGDLTCSYEDNDHTISLSAVLKNRLVFEAEFFKNNSD